MRRPTVKDVALRAGVAPTTVSNVLNDHPHVSPATRERVEAAVSAVGYRPSRAGRQLRAGRSDTIGLAIPELQSPYFAALAHVIMLTARRRGVTVYIDETGADIAHERAVAEGYATRGVDGIIFCPVALSLEELEQTATDVPTVLLGEYVTGRLHDHVAIDSLRSAEELTRHLLSLGCRSFAFASYQPAFHQSPGHIRRQGVQRALADCGLDLDERFDFATDGTTYEEGERVGSLLAQARGQVDALVCGGDVLAIGALKAFRDTGIAVPEEIAVVAWDDSPLGRYSSPSLTTVAHDLNAIADWAVRAVLDRHEHPDLPPRRFTAGHRMVVRESSGTRSA